MRCIKCDFTLQEFGSDGGLKCPSCESQFIERGRLKHAPLDLYLPEAVFKLTSIFCPMDNSKLRLASLEGLEIEICPQCKRLWFEKGELEGFGKKFKKKDDTPLWKKHQREKNDGLIEPADTIGWILDCVFLAIKQLS